MGEKSSAWRAILAVWLLFASGFSLFFPLGAHASEAPDTETGNACIRILSVDGGGVRGIIPAMILSTIEQQTGQPASHLFDLIAGTSTGAVISLALTKPDPMDSEKPQFSARDLVGFYFKESRRLFPRKTGSIPVHPHPSRTKYSPAPAKNVFHSYFGATLLDQAMTPVEIPTYDIRQKKPFFFKSWLSPAGLYPMREVARAAVAAPGYFPPVILPAIPHKKMFPRHVLVDGGVFANNPMKYALNDGSTLGDPEKGVFLLSLGTGTTKPHPKAGWHSLADTSPLGLLLFRNPDPRTPPYGGILQEMIRLQPQIPEENAPMDNSSPQNLKALSRITREYMEEQHTNLRRIIAILKKPRPSGCFTRKEANRRPPPKINRKKKHA